MLAGGVREHRLFERGERPRFDDVGRDGAGESGEDQGGQPACEGEDGAGGGHHDEKEAVEAAPSDPVAVAGDQHRDGCRPGEQ